MGGGAAFWGDARSCGNARTAQPLEKSKVPAEMERTGYWLLVNVFTDRYGLSFDDRKRIYCGVADNPDGTKSVRWRESGFWGSEKKEGRFADVRRTEARDADGFCLPGASAIYVKPVFSDIVKQALRDTGELAKAAAKPRTAPRRRRPMPVPRPSPSFQRS